MSVTDSSLDQSQSETLRCKRCQAKLPRTAAFCGNCGERVDTGSSENVSSGRTDITNRYRITSLLRRQPPTQLFLALDTQQKRPVVIHDIDISTLAHSEQVQAVAALQQEYDLLRQQRIPAIMPLVELRNYHHHLSVIYGWPFALAKYDAHESPSTPRIAPHQLSTLHDILQSGLGIPEQDVALTWLYRLSRAVEQLQRNGIVIGTIDPQTILISQHDYSGEPVLVVSWLPDLFSTLLPTIAQTNNPSPFCAPEALQAHAEPRSDIYSLGAILYLLLTGVTPDNALERTKKHLPSLLERNPHSDPILNTVVMQALDLAAEQRFQSTSDFADALEMLLPKSRKKTAGTPVKQKTEMFVSSTSVDNKTERESNANNLEDPFLEEPEDVTISVVPLQAQMARRYLSRMKTSKLGTDEPFTGEALVEEGSKTEQTTQESGENRIEREEREVAQGNTSGNQQTSEKHASRAMVEERPRTEQNANMIDAQKQDTNLDADQEIDQQHHEDTAETHRAPVYDADITQLETILINTDDVKVATAVVEEATNQSRQARNSFAPTKTTPGEEQEQAEKSGTSSDATGEEEHKDFSIARFKDLLTNSLPTIPRLLHHKDATTTREHAQAEDDASFLKRVQRFLVGEPQNSTSAAALIETPMRVQPHQGYTMRINVIGRPASKAVATGGLSSLSEGDAVHIEVRSALYQNYAYIVQQADVQIPAEGFVAEIAMPMQPLGSGPSGRRDRLHIYFMDAERNPLYEKPFVLEMFISHLVHRGQEGHNVLSIPL